MTKNSHIHIIDFEDRYKIDFKKIHQEWFESDFFKARFHADNYDYQVISNPSEHIIVKGGHIFLAKFDEKIVGTTALIPREDKTLELSKIAVLEDYRGLKISDELIKSAIKYSQTQGVKTVWLESIKVLKPALSLFRKYGFEEVPLGPNRYYERADIKMVLHL